jgi:mannose-6-phosphate isomerase-like protein (cupin superfamily)
MATAETRAAGTRQSSSGADDAAHAFEALPDCLRYDGGPQNADLDQRFHAPATKSSLFRPDCGAAASPAVAICSTLVDIANPSLLAHGEEDRMSYAAINLAQKFGLFHEEWQPKVIAEMNDYQFKLAKLRGDFVWHSHGDTDETFFVVDGRLRIDFRDGSVDIGPGELFVVPKGVEHKPYAESEVKLLLIEPRGVPNTGDAGGARTARNDVWI